MNLTKCQHSNLQIDSRVGPVGPSCRIQLLGVGRIIEEKSSECVVAGSCG